MASLIFLAVFGQTQFRFVGAVDETNGVHSIISFAQGTGSQTRGAEASCYTFYMCPPAREHSTSNSRTENAGCSICEEHYAENDNARGGGVVATIKPDDSVFVKSTGVYTGDQFA